MFPSHDSQGGGQSVSVSEGGTNDKQIMDYLDRYYQWQGGQNAFQSKTNRQNMLMQMGYNTLGAIQQGIYNHIEQNAAMQYNSAEALADRNFPVTIRCYCGCFRFSTPRWFTLGPEVGVAAVGPGSS